MMTSWIPNISGFLKRSRSVNEAEVLSPRPLTHQTKHPLTHLNTLSLDIAEQPELVRRLSERFPARLIGADWRLIFSTSSHGFSLSSFYRHCGTATHGPTLVCIQDTDNNVFGALVSSPLVLSEHFYGTGETFLFQASPRFQVYNWSGDNPHFARGNADSLTVGAGKGQFGLWLDSSLCQGRTQSCSTFNNQPLVPPSCRPDGDFVVKTIECWAFD